MSQAFISNSAQNDYYDIQPIYSNLFSDSFQSWPSSNPTIDGGSVLPPPKGMFPDAISSIQTPASFFSTQPIFTQNDWNLNKL